MNFARNLGNTPSYQPCRLVGPGPLPPWGRPLGRRAAEAAVKAVPPAKNRSAVGPSPPQRPTGQAGWTGASGNTSHRAAIEPLGAPPSIRPAVRPLGPGSVATKRPLTAATRPRRAGFDRTGRRLDRRANGTRPS